MIVGPERSYWILHHDHWNEEALRTFLLRRKRELVSVWQPLKKDSEPSVYWIPGRMDPVHNP